MYINYVWILWYSFDTPTVKNQLILKTFNYFCYNKTLYKKIIYNLEKIKGKNDATSFNKGWCVWRITSDAKGYTLSSSNLIALKLGLKQMRKGVSSGFICVYTFYLLIYNIAICKSIYIYVYMYTQTTLYLMIRRSNNCTIIRSCNGVYNI